MTMLSSEALADLTAKYVAQNGPIETTAIIVRDPKATPFNNKKDRIVKQEELVKSPAAERVLAHIRDNPGDHCELIVVATGLSSSTVRYIVGLNGIKLPRKKALYPSPQGKKVADYLKHRDHTKMTINDVCKGTGLGANTVRYALTKLGIKMKAASRKDPNAVVLGIIKEHASKHLTRKQLAEIAGCSPEYVAYCVREHNLPCKIVRRRKADG